MTFGPKVDYSTLANFSVGDFDLQTYYSAGRAAGLVMRSGRYFLDFGKRVGDSVIGTLSFGTFGTFGNFKMPSLNLNIKGLTKGKGKVHEKYFVGRQADLTELEYRKDYYTNIGKEIVDLTLSDKKTKDLTIIDTSKFSYSFDKIEDKGGDGAAKAKAVAGLMDDAPNKLSKKADTKSEAKEGDE
jgi:hypothetical protein